MSKGVRELLIVLLNLLIFWAALPAGLYLLGRLFDGLFSFGSPPLWLRWAAGVPVAAGVWICAHSVLLLRVKGKGLPISSLPPTTFVASGPYRLFRHPIYTGYTLMAFGGAVAAGSWGMALVAVPCFAIVWFGTWVKLYEEPGLLRRFGSTWRVYRDRTAIFFPLGLERGVRLLVRALFRAVFRVQVEGSEKVPRRGPVLLVSDHLSYLDFMFAQHTTSRPVLVPVTAEVFRKPLGRLFISLMGGTPKRRFCPDPVAAAALADEIEAGGAVGIAVEGERSWTGEMQLPAPGVALSASRFGCPVVPVAFIGSYKLWPRWCYGADRSVTVTVRVGEPFRLEDEIEGFVPGDPAQAEEVSRVIREKVCALRDASETSVDISRHPTARPELALWRCPVCGAEEQLGMEQGRLVCRACSARWSTSEGGDLSLEATGERDTVAGWAGRCGELEDLSSREGPVIDATEAEWREDPQAAVTMEPLHSLGTGTAVLHADRLEWRGEGRRRDLHIGDVKTVTTERNDTLQLGVGRGVVQLVFSRSSPLRWQVHVMRLKEISDVRRPA